jgi:hypothetical protein
LVVYCATREGREKQTADSTHLEPLLVVYSAACKGRGKLGSVVLLIRAGKCERSILNS